MRTRSDADAAHMRKVPGVMQMRQTRQMHIDEDACIRKMRVLKIRVLQIVLKCVMCVLKMRVLKMRWCVLKMRVRVLKMCVL